jgi:hypothetical protein
VTVTRADARDDIVLGVRVAAVWVVVVAFLAGRAAAGEPNSSCMASCTAATDAPSPDCNRQCPEFNSCSDLYHRDRAAYDDCNARVKACKDEAWSCSEGVRAAAREKWACHQQPDVRACCVEKCSGDLTEVVSTAPAWLYLDAILAGNLRIVDGDLTLRGYVGGEVEALFGASELRLGSVPFRIGPFFAAAVLVGGDATGGQLAGGVEALVSGFHRVGGLLVRAGAVYDLAEAASNQVGGLVRISLGLTTTGDSAWKPFSVWLYLEGDYIPAPEGDRIDLRLGLREGPLSFFVLFTGRNF